MNGLFFFTFHDQKCLYLREPLPDLAIGIVQAAGKAFSEFLRISRAKTSFQWRDLIIGMRKKIGVRKKNGNCIFSSRADDGGKRNIMAFSFKDHFDIGGNQFIFRGKGWR